MADIVLKYLTDLDSASGADAGDLLHINQDGSDKSITVDALVNAMFNMRFPIGKVEWFANNVNPNSIWIGSTWARLPGAGKTIRLANGTGSDALQSGGSDELTIAEENIPSHSHPVNLSTNSYDYGSKNTNSTGAHTHTIGYALSVQSGGAEYGVPRSDKGNTTTSSSGNHSHTVNIGAHGHTVNGDTGKSGSGEPVNITNAYIKLAGWYRTA